METTQPHQLDNFAKPFPYCASSSILISGRINAGITNSELTRGHLGNRKKVLLYLSFVSLFITEDNSFITLSCFFSGTVSKACNTIDYLQFTT